MKYLFVAIIFIAQASEIISLEVGEQKILKRLKVNKVTVSDAKIVKVKILKEGVLIVGNNVGKASLMVWTEREKIIYNIFVYKVGRVSSINLKQGLKEIEGLKFKRIGKKIMIYGKIYRKQDLFIINEIKKQKTFIFRVYISDKLKMILYKQILNKLKFLRIKELKVEIVNFEVYLYGWVKSDIISKKAQEIASQWMPVIINKIKVLFSKFDSYEINFKIYETNINTSHLVNKKNNIKQIFDLEKQTNLSNVMYLPSIICRNHKEVFVNWGGKLRYRTYKRRYAWHNLGLKIKTCLEGKMNKVALSINLEISNLNNDQNSQILNKVFNTNILIPLGKLVKLAWFHLKACKRVKGSKSLLSKIPLIGMFFKEKNKVYKDIYFVFCVVVKPWEEI